MVQFALHPVSNWNEGRALHWRSLTYFAAYRLLSALLLLGLGLWLSWDGSLPVIERWSYFAIALVYCVLATGFLFAAREPRLPFHIQLSLQVLLDVLAITALGHVAGGLRSGLPLLVMVSLAAAALIAQGSLVLFYAAAAALALLAAQGMSFLMGDALAADFLPVGLLCAAYFAIAIATHRLSRLARASEALVRQQAIDLANLAEVNQAVLKDMQDAVLVVDSRSRIRHSNPRAVELLGPLPPEPGGAPLARYSAELAERLRMWRAGGREELIMPLRAPANGRELRPRFSGIGGDAEQGVSILLEDITEAQEQARQGKLAALGRLTANIAHEIRNPLAAISHAAELLGEDYPRDPVEQKLIRIIHDNTVRLNHLVNEVLQLNRRDRAQQVDIDAASWLEEWRDQFCNAERVPRDWIRLELASGLHLRFDRNHLHQVLWNLTRNAVRFCCRQSGSVRICLERAPGTQGLQLDILDDGPGVASDQVSKLFEPFFTTDSQGTGLGLYIARELCVANNATLEYVEFSPGAQFRLILREC